MAATESYADDQYYNSEDALSFCDLPTLDTDHTELDPFLDSHQDDDDDDLFEFFVNPEILTDNIAEKEGIVFCGKPIIPPKQANNELVNTRHHRTRSGRLIRRQSSFKKCQLCNHSNSNNTTITTTITTTTTSRSSNNVVVSGNRTSSFRMGGPKRVLPGTGSTRCGGGGGGGWSHRKSSKVMIGLVKFQAPKMELSEMRRRQSRRSPAPLFPVAGDQGGEPAGAGRSSHWGLFRPLRCRAQFVSALTKASLRCLAHP